MANSKTYMLLLYLILYSGLCRGELDPDIVDQTESVFSAVSAASTLLDTVVSVADQVEDATAKAGEILAKVVKVFSGLSKVASSFGFIGAIIGMIFAFIPQSDPTLEYMKEQFGEVNRKLDSLSHQVSNLQKDVRWTAYASVYSRDESNIQNSWKKLQELMENAPLAKTKEEKVRMAERFTRFYEDTATENSVLKFYSYLTVKETSLKENLLNLVIEKFKGDFKVLVQFSSHFTGLMLKGLQLNLYYYALRGYNGERKVKEAAEQMGNVVTATQEAMIQCINNFEKFATEDVKEIGTVKWSNTKDLASDVKRKLEKKFNWYNWMVVVYNSGSKHMDEKPSIQVNKVNIVLFHREKGAVANVEIKKDIVNIWSKNILEFCRHQVENIYHSLTSKFDNIIMKHVDRIHLVDDPEDFAKTDDKGHVQLQCDSPTSPFFRKLKVIVFLTGNDAIAKSPCSNHPCKNGMCNPIKGTTGYICKCNKPFYGPTCEDTVENDLKWQEIQGNLNNIVLQPVPDLTAIYFSIQDLKKHTQQLANALQSDIKWTQIFVNYGDIISILRYFVKQHQFLQNRIIRNDRYLKEIEAHLTGKTFRYISNEYNNLMMGRGFGDKSNILESYRSAILLQKNSPDSIACSKDYVDSMDQFVRYMFALEKESQLAWFKYLLLTSKSKDVQEDEKIFKHHVEEQWKLFNRNGCGSLKAERLSNSFCEKPYHSTVNQQISITCTENYLAYPETIQCSRGKWSQLIICYKKPSANGNTVCKSENGKTVCEAHCTAGWAFPGGKTSITSTCSQQPCKSFTPPSCSGCADNRGCKGNEVCKGGTCVDGCKANPCGRNTVCSTSNHVRKCACQSGWSGSNPVTGCNYRDLQWVSTSTIPANTVKSKSGHPVCRTKGEDGGLHGGWLYYTSGSYRCNYEYGWWEPNSRNYEVLVDPCGGKGVEWKSGAFWQNSVVIAKAVNWGINFYVCSAMDNKHIPGKLYLARNGWHCNVGYGGKGHKLASFHSLVQRPCY